MRCDVVGAGSTCGATHAHDGQCCADCIGTICAGILEHCSPCKHAGEYFCVLAFLHSLLKTKASWDSSVENERTAGRKTDSWHSLANTRLAQKSRHPLRLSYYHSSKLLHRGRTKQLFGTLSEKNDSAILELQMRQHYTCCLCAGTWGTRWAENARHRRFDGGASAGGCPKRYCQVPAN